MLPDKIPELPIPDRLPVYMDELQVLLKKCYQTGYADGYREANDTLPQQRWHVRQAGSNYMYAIREARDVIEGLPTYAIAELLGIAEDDLKRLRKALHGMRYTQRSARYKGKVVKGWFLTPKRTPAVRAGQDEELPI